MIPDKAGLYWARARGAIDVNCMVALTGRAPFLRIEHIILVPSLEDITDKVTIADYVALVDVPKTPKPALPSNLTDR